MEPLLAVGAIAGGLGPAVFFLTRQETGERRDEATANENRSDHCKDFAGIDVLCIRLNPFLKFLPMPQLVGVWGQFLGALFVSHFVWLAGATQARCS